MVVYGLLGYPLRYSLSPAIHQAAYRALGLSAAYLLWPTAPVQLATQIATLRQRGDVGGWNVTVPHKSAIMPLLDQVEPSALAAGAVNTVIRSGDRLIGANTDLAGFRTSLQEAGASVWGQAALVLGAGGAARAVCSVLLAGGVRELYLVNRTLGKALQLAHDLPSGIDANSGISLAAEASAGQPALASAESCLQVISPQDLAGRAGAVDLVINCTSSQNPWPSFDMVADEFWSRGRGLAVDLAYGRMLAGFLAAAERRGWRTLSGEGMLFWQAVHAFQMWTGLQAPTSAMRQALLTALSELP